MLNRAAAMAACGAGLPAAQRCVASCGAAPPASYFGCAVYVSTCSPRVLAQLEAAARDAPAARLANLFVDEPYNRTNFTLVGSSVPHLAAAAAGLAQAALAALDLRGHAATHPRLGTVDHISCHPLPLDEAPGGAAGEAQQQQQQQQQVETAALAQAVARQLGAGPQAVPVFTYGWAHPQQRRLDALRRQLGYFRGSTGGSWQGALRLQPDGQPPPQQQQRQEGCGDLALPCAPCYGPAAAPARSGVCCVGASPWVVNYNVLLHTDDMPAARAVARAVSQRGGGLPGVQAMALRHTQGIEVACNLLDPAAAPPEVVLAAVRRLAAQHGGGGGGLVVGAAYRTNKTPQELVAAALRQGL